ncbi:TniB family NTP-binding protein [Shewanella spartinae]|uniref:TniB family NTP-binding protein n=1 Tax=Shewanella spartinae TaxID=2864205 RepID=UPI001C6606F3|nr:TniB family NTP-binding protein [Shewanella spartinae]QYJ93644.1 TniB family NTP-binding protein [Shewanella spartinae]
MSILTAHQMEQLRRFSDCFVMHPQVKIIFNDFDELRLNRNFQSDQQCMLLTGDTGVGKSHLINHYKKRVLAGQSYSHDSIPVLVSRISSGRGLDATLTQIISDLELFGSHQRKKRGYATDLTKKLVNSLIRAQVELLIINEFQELIEFKMVQERQLIANALKFISEEAKVPIVLVGMPWAEQIAEEPQWSSRLIRRRQLEYFSFQNNSKYYRQYLMGLAKHMPFDSPPKLQGKEISIPLFAACKGENRALKHLLTEALKIALLDAAGTLKSEHLADAYEQLFSSQQGELAFINPFTQPLDKIKISEVMKPSRYNANAMFSEDMLIPREFSEPFTLAQLPSK